MAENDQDTPDAPTPKINVAAALGEAGHEVADLGFEGIPDKGPLLRHAGDTDTPDDEVGDALDLAAKGITDLSDC